MAKKPNNSRTQIIPPSAPDQDMVQEQILQQLAQSLHDPASQQDPSVTVSMNVEDEHKPMDEQTFLAILNQLEERAKDHVRNKVMHRATKALEYYLAQPIGDFVQTGAGRSDFVDSAVADTVNWVECPLIEAFCGTQKIVDFLPRSSAQDRSAEMLNAMVNHVWKLNSGYEVMRSWIKDALITPAGIVKIFWEPNTEPESEEWFGISDDEYAIMALAEQAGECVIVSHTEYDNSQKDALAVIQHGLALAGANIAGIQAPPIAPQIQQGMQQGANPMQIAQNTQVDPNLPQIGDKLHDVKIHIYPDPKKGKVKIDNIPLEEFYVDPRTKRIQDARYVAHARTMTISELRGMGFDDELLASIDDREDDPRLTEYYLVRNRMTDANAFDFASDDYDPSLREVLVVEAYLLVDYDNDGLAEWRRVQKSGNTILSNERCDGNPFCMMSSMPISHSLFGLSIAELAMNIQKQNTALVRSMIDNVSYGANAAIWVDANVVDVQHALDIGPGTVIPVDGDGSAAIGVVPNSSGDIAGVTTMLEMLSTINQERTGVQKLTRGSDADIVNETASGYAQMSEYAESRTKLIARHFAETGVKPAVLRIQSLLAQHPDAFMEVRLNGQTMEADPMDARNQYDTDVQVGLGTGDKGRTLGALNQIMALQMQAMQNHTGMVDLNNIYNTAERIVNALGVSNVGEFVQKPASPQPQMPPPQMSPDKQADIQIQQQKVQSDQAQQERQAQLDAMRIKAQADSDDRQAQRDHEYRMAQLQMQERIAEKEAILKIAAQRELAAFQAGVSPEDEAKMFDETVTSTANDFASKLTGINMQMSGEMDDLMKTIGDAPDPSAPDQQ